MKNNTITNNSYNTCLIIKNKYPVFTLIYIGSCSVLSKTYLTLIAKFGWKTKSHKIQFTSKSIKYHTDIINYYLIQPHFHLRSLAGLKANFKLFQG